MEKNQLSVRLHGEHMGVLEQNQAGKMQFTYDPSASSATSVGMPIREQPYDYIQCEAFFGEPLPENSQQIHYR